MPLVDTSSQVVFTGPKELRTSITSLTWFRRAGEEALNKVLSRVGDTEPAQLSIVGVVDNGATLHPFYLLPKAFTLNELPTDARKSEAENRHSLWGLHDRPFGETWYGRNRGGQRAVTPEARRRFGPNFLWTRDVRLALSGGTTTLRCSVGVNFPQAAGVAPKWDLTTLAASVPHLCRAVLIDELVGKLKLDTVKNHYQVKIPVDDILELVARALIDHFEEALLPDNEGYPPLGRRLLGRRYELYEAVNHLASATYEKRENACGRLALVAPNQVGSAIWLRNSESLRNTKLLRKMVECSIQGKMLCVGPGLGGRLRAFAWAEVDSQADAVFFEFIGHGNWQMSKGARLLLRKQDGKLGLINEVAQLEELKSDYREQFDEELPKSLEDYHRWILEFGRGAVLVVSAEAEQEAKRLIRENLSIIPTRLAQNDFKGFCKIDGAFLVGPDGVCHAVGCILDGAAHPRADRSRGSRYNSTSRYIQGQEARCLAVVYSDDGHVDILTRAASPGFEGLLKAVSDLTQNFTSLEEVSQEVVLSELFSEDGDSEIFEDVVECCRPTDLAQLGAYLADITVWLPQLELSQLEALMEVVTLMREKHGANGLVDLENLSELLKKEMAEKSQS